MPDTQPLVLDMFSAKVGALLDKIEVAKQESQALAAQLEALLPQLVSGQISVSHLAAAIGELR